MKELRMKTETVETKDTRDTAGSLNGLSDAASVEEADAPVAMTSLLASLRTLVPLKTMSDAHLESLLAAVRQEQAYAGQVVLRRGSCDGEHVYLRHGRLRLNDEQGHVQTLGSGQSLLPIAQSQPRRLMAVAETDCGLLRINSERLDQLLTWSQVADYLHLVISVQRELDADVDWMMRLLKSNLFLKVSPLNVEQIFSCLSQVTVRAGEQVIRQGDLGDCCYFIKTGEALVTRQKEGVLEHLASIGCGRCFGEDALVNDAPRNANVTMSSDGVLLRLHKQDFFKLLREPLVASVPLVDLAQTLEAYTPVDVRSEEEYTQAHLPCAVNIPLNLLAIKARLLDKARPYLLYCDTGRRSRAAAHLLVQQGYQVQALGDCAVLFNQARYGQWLQDPHTYVLRDGQSLATSI